MGKPKTLCVLLSLLLTSACSWNNKPTITQKPPLAIPAPNQLSFTPVKWVVIDSMICVDTKNYESLSENMERIQGFIVIQNTILKTYRDYYESK